MMRILFTTPFAIAHTTPRKKNTSHSGNREKFFLLFFFAELFRALFSSSRLCHIVFRIGVLFTFSDFPSSRRLFSVEGLFSTLDVITGKNTIDFLFFLSIFQFFSVIKQRTKTADTKHQVHISHTTQTTLAPFKEKSFAKRGCPTS